MLPPAATAKSTARRGEAPPTRILKLASARSGRSSSRGERERGARLGVTPGGVGGLSGDRGPNQRQHEHKDENINVFCPQFSGVTT
jgi:hypothetical protein